MSTPTGAIREHSMANNEEYQRLQQEHAHYASQLDHLASKSYLTEQERLEEVRLKKLKLRVKDQMQRLHQPARSA